MTVFASTMIATVAVSVLKHSAAFQHVASPSYYRLVLRMAATDAAAMSAVKCDSDFDSFSSKVSFMFRLGVGQRPTGRAPPLPITRAPRPRPRCPHSPSTQLN